MRERNMKVRRYEIGKLELENEKGETLTLRVREVQALQLPDGSWGWLYFTNQGTVLTKGYSTDEERVVLWDENS